MTKKLASIATLAIIPFAFAPGVSAQEAPNYPLMYDILNKQTQTYQENHKKELESRKLNPQFTPALSDNFTYETIYSGNAITIKKAKETELIVQEIDLKNGVKISSESLEVESYNPKTGEPQYIKKNINETLRAFDETPTSIINGQFFDPKSQPSELSFALKSDNIIRTAGADNRNEKKHILHINDNYAEILPHSWKNLEQTQGSFAMVNLSVNESRYKDEKIGRTYMCLAEPKSKNTFGKILTFVAEAMDEGLLENEIYKHGCTPKTTSKLDSSGSSRFWHNNKTLYGHNHSGKPDYRKIPHAIAFFDKK